MSWDGQSYEEVFSFSYEIAKGMTSINNNNTNNNIKQALYTLFTALRSA